MAKVGTGTATIVAISPEQLAEIHPRFARLWNSGQHEAALRLLNQHGGASFHTGGDGAFEVLVPEATEETGYVAPYGTPSYPSHAVGNPFGVPAWQIGAGVAVLGGIGFVAYRMNQRKKLTALLAANVETLQLGTPEALTNEEMPLFSTVSVVAAYSAIMDRLPEPEPMLAVPLLQDIAPKVAEAVGAGQEMAQSLWEFSPAGRAYAWYTGDDEEGK